MTERRGFQPFEPEPEHPQSSNLPQASEIIERVSKELNLNPQAAPEWNLDPSRGRIFPDESPSILGRRQALHCLDHLYYYLEWRFQGDKDDTVSKTKSKVSKPDNPRVTQQNLLATFDLIREEQLLDFDPDYELSHVLGASKRHIAWLKEKRLYEETMEYNYELKVHEAIHGLLEEVVHPEELRLMEDIEAQIRQYVRTAYPPTDKHPAYDSYQSSLTAPYLEKRFRDYLNHTPIRLLPEEADEYIARDASSWCHEFLVDKAVQAREQGLAFTPEDLTQQFDKYLRSEQYEEREKGQWADFTLHNVFGQSKRRLLYWHSVKDHKPDYHQSYRDTLAVYNLITQALPPTLPFDPYTPYNLNNPSMEQTYKEPPHSMDNVGEDDNVPF